MALSVHSETVAIKAGQTELRGALWLPDACLGVILFVGDAHSNRVKPPGDYVASVLCNAHLGTFWVDLPGPRPVRHGHASPGTEVLAQRLGAACDWLARRDSGELPIGLFGAGSGAAAVLQLAAAQGRRIAAMVLRGGRTDLADRLAAGKISAPTLLIVGGLDDGAVESNRAIYAALRCKKRFEIIPGATRAFDEPGSLEVVARMSRSWFLQHAGVHV